jgi:hypothetical protein
MTLPVQKPRRRLGWLVVLGLFGFGAGLLAGPPVHDQTYAFFDHVGPKLAARMPRLFGWLGPPPSPEMKLAPAAPASGTVPTPAPTAAPPTVMPTVTPVPSPAPQPAVAAGPRRPSAHAEAPARAPQPARPAHEKSPAKTAAAAKAGPVAEAPAPKSAVAHDPFDTGSEGSGSARKAKAPAEPAAPVHEPKPAVARSSDSLDNLMADVMTDGKGKPKKHDKAIDAMLKDVQKSGPAPAAKREDAPALEPLTSSEIAKAMSGVKTRSSACAQRLGQSGIAELKIAVGKDGKVHEVSVGGKVAGSPLGACIEKAVRATTFRPNAGLRFDYRIEAH